MDQQSDSQTNTTPIVSSSESPTPSPSPSRLRSLRNKLRHLPWQWRAVIIALIFGAAGVIGLFISYASPTSDFSTDPNDVIVQYSLPHVPMGISTTGLATPTTPPFSLYGNGLLVCGHDSAMPFMGTMTMPAPGSIINAPTSTMLSADQIRGLLGKIEATGFFKLKPEYYKLPVVEKQDIVQVNQLSGRHSVLYYNDVAAPTAYSQTVALLQQTCSSVTAPYLSSSPVVRSIRTTQTTPNVSSVTSLAQGNSSLQQTLQQSLSTADSQAIKAKNDSTQKLPDAASAAEAAQKVSATVAQALAKQLRGKASGYVKQGDQTYQVSVDQPLPVVRNPLKIDYRALRQSKPSGLGARLKQLIIPHAYADTPASIPIRVVVLLPSTGGATDTQAKATTIGQAVSNWYCGQASFCYNYKGVSVIRGSQTSSYYMTCHGNDPCQGDTLASILYNISEQDSGTVYRSDIDTVVVTGWDTGGYPHDQSCGYGLIGNNLALVDLHEATIDSGASTFCQPGHDIAHELGHTFGLNHTGNGTLMDGTPYTQLATFCDINDSKEPLCKLDSTQAATLRSETQYQISWSDWQSLGGTIVSTPAAVSRAGGQDLFARNSANNLYQKNFAGGSWQPWRLLMNGTVDSPTVASWASNRLDVFTRGSDNSLRHTYWGGGAWAPWQSLGGITPSAPAAISRKANSIDVFVRSSSNALDHKYWTGSAWSGWQALGGSTVDAPAVASWSADRLDVLTRASDNSIHHIYWTSSHGWSAWESLGGTTKFAPAAVSSAPNRLDIFIRGTDNALYQRTWYGTGWTAWTKITNPDNTVGAPAAAAAGNGHINLYSRGSDGAVYEKSY